MDCNNVNVIGYFLLGGGPDSSIALKANITLGA